MWMIPLSFGFHHDLFLMIQLQSPFRKDFTSARHLPIGSQLITTIWNLWARNSTDVISVDIYWFTEGSWGHGKIYRPVLPRLLPMDSSTDQFLLSGKLFSSLGPQSIFRSLTPPPHTHTCLFSPIPSKASVALGVFYLSVCVWSVFWSFLLIPFLTHSFLLPVKSILFLLLGNIFSVLPGCHRTPCQSWHNKSQKKNKCLTCQWIFHFPSCCPDHKG